MLFKKKVSSLCLFEGISYNGFVMKKYKKTILIILLVALLLSCSKEDDLRLESLSDSQKGAYSYGMLQATNDKDAGIVLDGSYFARGVLDGFDSTFIYSNTEANDILQAYSKSGISGDCGKEIDSVQAIKSLKKPEGIHKQFSYIAGYLYTPPVETEDDVKLYIAGYFDVLYGRNTLLDKEKATSAFSSWRDKLLEESEAKAQKTLEENLQKAEDFLAENKNKEGVVVLEDGLQIKKNVSSTTGDIPQETDSIIVDYKLTLLDGTVADQGTDITFSLQSLIPGFVKAALHMREGESITAYIHPELGYGERDLGNIGPNSLLIFDITLKKIKK